MSVEIDIRDRASATLMLRARQMQPERLHRVFAAAALPVVQRHLQGNAARNRNAFGARSSFWNRMLAGTTAEATADAAIVRMPREVRARVQGAVIRPGEGKKYLTIPARTESYGRSAREFNDLRFVQFASGAKALVRAAQTNLGTRQEAGGEVLYWLKSSVTITGDRELLPADEALRDAAVGALAGYLSRRGEGA
jgi:hypothetical protein